MTGTDVDRANHSPYHNHFRLRLHIREVAEQEAEYGLDGEQ